MGRIPEICVSFSRQTLSFLAPHLFLIYIFCLKTAANTDTYKHDAAKSAFLLKLTVLILHSYPKRPMSHQQLAPPP
jgi:hypothetical protein